jgi:hypothetical protein
MQLKNIATATFGVLLSVKAMAYDKEPCNVEQTRIASSKKTLSDEQKSYKICTDYRANDLAAFNAAALGSQQSAIFGSRIAPSKLESLLDIPLNDAYVFSAELELTPESSISTPEKNNTSVEANSGTVAS